MTKTTTKINSLHNFKKLFFRRFKILLISAALILVCANNIFAQNIGEKTGNKAWDYMHGRSLIGINFGPTLWAGLFDIAIGMVGQSTVGDMLNNTGLGGFKHFAFGLGFSYDFAPLNFMTVGFDIGFAVGNIRLGDNKISFSTVPWSLNVKFFFWKKAPFGFFLSPRFGGTAMSLSSGSGPELVAQGYNDMKISSHGGFYMSLELGWRIQLFPKRGANWPVQAGIDISLFDIGYYVAPWTSSILNNKIFGNIGDSIKSYEKFANIRALLFPRLGITIRF